MRELGQYPTQLELKLIISEADKDGSGTLTLDEFAKYLAQPPRGRFSLEQLESQFEVFDQDGDGMITLQEMDNIMAALNLVNYAPDVVRELFSQIDANKDGKINLQEFLDGVM
uniref:EF-hand domain-containing protein n=1 Tax=Plectus sambesii TaxID=2011161 RepID=A0A914WJP7_9BILA